MNRRSIILSLLALAAVDGRDAAAQGNAPSPAMRAVSSGLGSLSPRLSEMTTKDWSVEVLADDLRYPWSISFDGSSIILTEAPGTIVVIRDGRLQRHSVQTSDAVVNDGGSGLLGMALAGNFATSRLAYLYYSYRSASGLANKVVKVINEGESWRETHVLLDGIPGHQLYNGGRIAIGPDRQLYVTTGWIHQGSAAQDLENLAGKILRMGQNGEVPADNPFTGSHVCSYGHRNPQGLAWNDANELFISEHGESGHDEINLVMAGANYGWPDVTGSQTKAGVERPLLHSGNSTWAPSGIAFVDGQLLVAALQGRGLFVHDRPAGRLKPIFSTGERVRDVSASADALYVITTNMSPRSAGPRGGDRLLRLSPKR
jgi:glucose/arabinose dehydrogenase